MAHWSKRRRLLVRWSLVSTLALAAAITWAVASRETEKGVAPGQDVEGLTSVLAQRVDASEVPIRFEDVSESAGITFRHFPFARDSLLPEDMGSGVAAADYDGDGFVDLFFVNFGGNIANESPAADRAGRARLYRNVKGTRFEDVTERAGLGHVGFGMGAAWGDYDGDADLDLYVTAYGDNRLYENRGDGTFVDVTERCGVQDPRFGAGCAWADFDRDGHLDLYVCNYVGFVLRAGDRSRTERQYATEQPYTLNPSSYPPQPNSLFRNRGDGTFEEVSHSAGVADPGGRSLSASWVDMDNDGWVDLYVANDVSNNGVFRNRGDGTFEDIGAPSLAADYRGAMGIAVADVDDDLDQDLLITHWIAQENALFRNVFIDRMFGDAGSGALRFLDTADECGLGQISLDMVGWATGFCDFDNDGRRDLWVLNGSTLEEKDDHSLLQPQRPFVFWNLGDRGFVDVAALTCDRLGTAFVGRGGTQLDFDGDGRVDLALVEHGGNAILLKNTSKPAGHWLGVQLRQSGGNTFALGGRVYVTIGDRTQMAEVGSNASYLSQDEFCLRFGLGEATQVDGLRIVWPDGAEDRMADLPVDRVLQYHHDATYPVLKATDRL